MASGEVGERRLKKRKERKYHLQENQEGERKVSVKRKLTVSAPDCKKRRVSVRPFRTSDRKKVDR